MPTYILLTKLSAGAGGPQRNAEEVGKEIGRRVRAHCPGVVWKAHYATLGPHDFMDIFEAKDEAQAGEVAYITGMVGHATTETWTALSYERFIRVAKDATRMVGGTGHMVDMR